jgi:MFS family permease
VPARAEAARPAALRAVVRDPAARSLTWLLTVECVVIGALDVLYVVLAIGVLHESGSVAGYLNAAFGAGGVIGVVATATLVGRARIAPFLAAGLGVWAVALVVLGASSGVTSALLLLAAAGIGRTLVDVAGRTLLQRSTDPEALTEVFGVLEGVSMAGLAVGSLLAAALTAVAGGRGAVVGIGVLLPVALLVVVRGLLAADRRSVPLVEMARLRALPMFELLGGPTLETLAREAAAADAPPGRELVREGEPGRLFYVIAAGEVDVSVRGTVVRRLTAGEGFGEIALLRDAPRTATCTARTRCTLLTIERDAFLAALGATGAARTAADEVAVERLAHAAS